ncbi:MAG TPA: hypothetical protein DIT64_02610 [Verrucomicrobiales bacterium]|nr:hypothetical protein [Verrucomicrobiales bacterium]
MNFTDMHRFLIVLILSTLAADVSAQTPPPKPSPPNDGPGGKDKPPFRGDGPKDRGGDWRGGFPGFGRPPMRHDGFDQLPEDERRKVREALDKVWHLPEVISARDEAMRANEKMRDTIRECLKKSDPEAAAIVERLEPREPFDFRKLPPLPPTDSESFPLALVNRMGSELEAFSRPDRREETRGLHLRIMDRPEIKAALDRLRQTRGEERLQAMHELRKAYREAVGAEFQAARERRAAEGGGVPPKKPD